MSALEQRIARLEAHREGMKRVWALIAFWIVAGVSISLIINWLSG